MATGELRATMALTEPGGGSDLQAMRTVARRDGDDYVINGIKTWITNARRSGLIALLCKTDPDAEPAHRGVSILLVEKVPGFTVSSDLPKLGYKGVESCELNFDDCRVPADALLGADEGHGLRSDDEGPRGRPPPGRRAGDRRRTGGVRGRTAYAQDRESFGKPIWQHQAVGNLLADMGTKLTAARALLLSAAERFDSGERCDMEAGMAKLFASEAAMEIALDAVRVHGGYGYSTEFDVERYFRDAPLMIVGEGTNEIQKERHRQAIGQARRAGSVTGSVAGRAGGVLPLSGLTVLSLEHAVAAPFATRQLADLGARVIKVERPGSGDFARQYDDSVNGLSSYFVWLNRSKESIALDVKSAQGREVLHELAERADVIVQNLGPGAAARLGLSAEAVRARDPRKIVVGITGWGSDGPWADRKAYDLLVQCETGLVSLTGTPADVAKVGVSIADIAAGMYAFSGVLAALYRPRDDRRRRLHRGVPVRSTRRMDRPASGFHGG